MVRGSLQSQTCKMWIDVVELRQQQEPGKEPPMDVDTMVEHYIIAALWSTADEEGTPLDENYDADDLAPETRAAAEQVCRSFADLVGDDLDGMDPEQAGHDLWLTREGHGVGFWDRGLGERGDRLTKWAKTFGEADWYVGDDGLIYGSD